MQRALLQARLAPATMGRRELPEQMKNENARRRFANRHCAIAVLDLDFLGGLGLGLPTNPASTSAFSKTAIDEELLSLRGLADPTRRR